MGQMITFQRPDGQSVPAWLAEPAGADATTPGLVVVQEWWGLNDQIKGVAERYAQQGYRVLVPDLYRGKVTLEAAEAEHLMTCLDFGAAAGQDIRGAVQYLKAGGTKVGVTGYCMGGALTFLSLVFVPEVDAGAVWYGFPPLEYIDAGKIKAPVLAHFAQRDAFFPIGTVDQIADKLQAAGVNFEFHRYDTLHAFANETQVDPHRVPTNQYDPAATELAWGRTLAFLAQHLK